MRRKGYDERTWFTFSYSPVRDDDGTVAGMFCACTETTAQVLAEERRVRESERQQLLFKQAPGFITILKQPEHVFEFVNDSYFRFFGDRQYDLALVHRLPWRAGYAAKLICPASHFCSKAIGLV